MKRHSLSALFILACTSALADGEQGCPASVHMKDSSVLRGTITKGHVSLATGFGDITVPLALLAEIKFDGQNPAKIVFKNRDTLTARVKEDVFPFESALGKMSLSFSVLQRITFSSRRPAAAQEGLAFSCDFDSMEEIAGCLPDRPDRHIGGTLVEGVNGQALQIDGEYDTLLTEFSPEALNPEAGCIEFWAKVNDPSNRFSWSRGHNPAFFLIKSNRRYINLVINGNNGAGLSGLCGVADGMLCGKDWFNNPQTSYERILGRNPNGWHHFAVVWDRRGIDIPEHNGPKPNLATFLDGRLYASAMKRRNNAEPPNENALDGETALSLLLLPREGDTHPNSFAIDELRIWSYAKTEFALQKQEITDEQ